MKLFVKLRNLMRLYLALVISFLFLGGCISSPDKPLASKLSQYATSQQQCEAFIDGKGELTGKVEKECKQFLQRLGSADSTADALANKELKKGEYKRTKIRYSQERNKLKQQYDKLLRAVKNATSIAIKKDDLKNFMLAINFPQNSITTEYYVYMRSKAPSFNDHKGYRSYERKEREVLLKRGKKELAKGNENNALQLLEESAQMGNIDAAYLAAGLYKRWHSAKMLSKAASLYRQACDGEEYKACAALGGMYEKGRGVDINKREALLLYERSCEHDVSKSCTSAGRMYYYGNGVNRDKTKSVRLYAQACQDENAQSCAIFANELYEGKKEVKDYVTALALYKLACEGGERSSCEQLGYIYLEGKGADRNVSLSSKYFKSSCEYGCATGHYKLASDLYTSNKESGSKQVALDLYLTACTLENGAACRKSAEMFIKGYGVEIDAARGLQLYEEGCQYSDGHSCVQLAKTYAKRKNNMQYADKAIGYYRKGCRLGETSTCLVLGASYETQDNLQEARSFYNEACSQGLSEGCTGYTRVTAVIVDKREEERRREKRSVLQKSAALRQFEAIECHNLTFSVINEDKKTENLYYISGSFLLAGETIDKAALQTLYTEYRTEGYSSLLVHKMEYSTRVQSEKGFTFSLPTYTECPQKHEWERLSKKTEAERKRISRARRGVLPSDTALWSRVDVYDIYTITEMQALGVMPEEYLQWKKVGVSSGDIKALRNAGHSSNSYDVENIKRNEEYRRWEHAGLSNSHSIERLKKLGLDWDDYAQWSEQGVRSVSSIERYTEMRLYPSLYKTLKEKGKLRGYLRTGHY